MYGWCTHVPSSSLYATLQLGGREVFLREDREDFELTGSSGSRSSPFRADRGARRSASRSGVAVVGRRLFVHNLSPETTWQSLKDYFRICGNVMYTEIFMVRVVCSCFQLSYLKAAFYVSRL